MRWVALVTLFFSTYGVLTLLIALASLAHGFPIELHFLIAAGMLVAALVTWRLWPIAKRLHLQAWLAGASYGRRRFVEGMEVTGRSETAE